jgi:hypothetical protein
MSDDTGELYGKIDALLGKRVGFAAVTERYQEDFDFPLLTEVVEPPAGETEPIPLDLERPYLSDAPEPALSSEVGRPDADARADALRPDTAHSMEGAAGSGGDEEVASEAPEDGTSGEVNAVPDITVDAGVPEPAAAAPRARVHTPWLDTPQRPAHSEDARLEALLRRVVREELERLLGRG